MSEKTRRASCNCGKLSVTYEGPDPDRISLCQCYECQKRTGSVASVQARLPIEHVTVEGRSTTWTVPSDSSKPASRCDSLGATYHFCPECGSTLYWDLQRSRRPRCRGRRLHRPDVSAADDFRI